ncbi:MAG: hypothetical protein AAF411_09610 [Myxococcota bacterium]
MTLETATLLVHIAQGWLALGALVAAAFLFVAFGRVDEGGKGASVATRLFLLPGCALLWPVIALRWWRSK